MKSNYLTALVFCLYTCILVISCNSNDKTITTLPNFIIIMADDLGYADLSGYGNPDIKTPNLDQLARDGVRFTDFHSNGAVCSPTRAALLTGLYQQRVGIPGVVTTSLRDSVGMHPVVNTMAEYLKPTGYATGIFGKWHLGYKQEFNPIYQGFDEFKGFIAGNVDYHSHLDNQHIFDWWNGNQLRDDSGYTTDLITNYALDFIIRKQEEPFFLYIPYPAPHDPLQGRNDGPIRVKGLPNRKVVPSSIPTIYKEMVEVMDEGIGKIIQTLIDLELEKNTLIFFCSDNGPTPNGSKGALRGFKGSLYEGGHRVPAMIKWPGKIAPGQICDETLLTMDVLPTLLDIIGQEVPDQDGESFTPVLFQQDTMMGRDLFWSFKTSRVIRRGNWKMINRNEEVALYDLEQDLGENYDLKNDFPALFKSLNAALSAWDISVNKSAAELKSGQ